MDADQIGKVAAEAAKAAIEAVLSSRNLQPGGLDSVIFSNH